MAPCEGWLHVNNAVVYLHSEMRRTAAFSGHGSSYLNETQECTSRATMWVVILVSRESIKTGMFETCWIRLSFELLVPPFSGLGSGLLRSLCLLVSCSRPFRGAGELPSPLNRPPSPPPVKPPALKSSQDKMQQHKIINVASWYMYTPTCGSRPLFL